MFSVRNSIWLKRILVVTFLIVAFLTLFTVAFQWYFNPSHRPETSLVGLSEHLSGDSGMTDKEIIEKLVADLEDDNGAKYYLMACLSLVNLPDDDPVWERFDDVVENGWQDDDPALEAFVRQNEPTFELIRKGISQEYCSMPIEEPSQGSVYLSDYRHVARLFIAQATLFEKNREYDKARETYTDLLRFASDIPRGGSLVHAANGIAMEGMAYHAMDSYLGDVDHEAVCKKLLDELIDIEEGRASLRDILESEFTFSRRWLESLGIEFLYWRFISEDPTIGEYFLDTVRRTYGYLRFRMWLPKQLKDMDTFHQVMLDASTQSYPEIFSSQLEDKIPKNELSEIQFEAIYKMMFTVAGCDVNRWANIVKTALRLHFLKHGGYPETLEELSALAPERVLTDPFSEERFIYKKTETGYLFYSLGPDMDDDGGKKIEPPYCLESDGDMVFELGDTNRF